MTEAAFCTGAICVLRAKRFRRPAGRLCYRSFNFTEPSIQSAFESLWRTMFHKLCPVALVSDDACAKISNSCVTRSYGVKGGRHKVQCAVLFVPRVRSFGAPGHDSIMLETDAPGHDSIMLETDANEKCVAGTPLIIRV